MFSVTSQEKSVSKHPRSTQRVDKRRNLKSNTSSHSTTQSRKSYRITKSRTKHRKFVNAGPVGMYSNTTTFSNEVGEYDKSSTQNLQPTSDLKREGTQPVVYSKPNCYKVEEISSEPCIIPNSPNSK